MITVNVRSAIRAWVLGMGIVVGVFGLSSFALAMDLGEAKAALANAKQQGVVCETTSGYLEAKEGNGEAKQIVETINKARKAEYQRIANDHGIDLSKVELVAGKKAVDKTPAGQYVKIDGKWIKK